MPTLEQSDKRRQHETEQNRQCDRYKDFTCKIQSRDNDRNDYKIIESQPSRNNHVLASKLENALRE